MQKIKQTILAFLLTAALLYFAGDTFNKNFFEALIIFFGALYLVDHGFRSWSKRRACFATIFALPVSLAIVLGKKIADFGTISGNLHALDLVSIVGIFGLLLFGVVYLLFTIDHGVKRSYNKKITKREMLKISLIIFACWLPLFLVTFPGTVSVDTAVQIGQTLGERPWSNWHPVLHTALISVPVNIGTTIFGDLTAGIALCVLLHMILLALIYGYVVKFIFEESKNKTIGYLSTAFFALCPVISCYSITVWKDVLFSAAFLVFFIQVYKIVKQGRDYECDWRQKIKNFALLLAVGFLRNGGVLIVVAAGIAMAIFFKKMRKGIIIGTVALAAAITVIQGPVYNALGIQKSPFMESMSVPAQQIAYVARKEKLNPDELETLSKFADINKLKQTYTPDNADPAKNAFNYDAVEEDKAGFLKLWFSIMTHNFAEYVYSYILHTHAYWYPQTGTWAIDLSHTHDPIWMKAEYTDASLLGDGMQKAIHNVEKGVSSSVWGGWLNNVSIMIWALILVIIIFIYQRRYYMFVPLSGVIMYILSMFIASPVPGIFRYVFSLLLILPVAIVISFTKAKERKKS